MVRSAYWLTVSWIKAPRPAPTKNLSLPPRPLRIEPVVGRLRVRDPHAGSNARHVHDVAVAADAEVVAGVRAVHGDGVGLSVAGAAAEDAFEVDVRQVDVGAAEVVDDRVVGAAECFEVDPLDVVGVHGDVAEVAEEAEAVAVGGEVEVLAASGAVEQEPVRAALPLDGVAAVAGIPDERVVAGAEDADVGPAVAVDAVVLRPTEERVGAVAAVERVVAVAAEQLELEQRRRPARTRDRVRAVEAVDSERLHAGHVHEGRDVRGGHPCVAGHRRRGDVDDIRCRGAEQPHEVSAALPVDREQVVPCSARRMRTSAARPSTAIAP